MRSSHPGHQKRQIVGGGGVAGEILDGDQVVRMIISGSAGTARESHPAAARQTDRPVGSRDSVMPSGLKQESIANEQRLGDIMKNLTGVNPQRQILAGQAK